MLNCVCLCGGGTDCAPQKEFFQILIRKLMDPDYGKITLVLSVLCVFCLSKFLACIIEVSSWKIIF